MKIKTRRPISLNRPLLDLCECRLIDFSKGDRVILFH